MGRNEKGKETKMSGLGFPPLQSLPLGFRFHPTDEELINHYLKGKISGRTTAMEAAVIPEVDLCRSEPWDLPELSAIRSSDPEWFFFAAIDRKYPNGSRSNRATAAGYWKATGKDRFIRSKKAVVGMKKTLVFHRGRAPKGARSNWVMHEYRTTEPIPDSADQGGFVLCRVMKKSEEKTPSFTVDETERSGLSPVSIQCLPDNMLHDADALEKSATPQNQELLESDMQPLTDATGNQTSGFGSEMSDRADSSITCHQKPEESHCNSNITSDVDDYEADEVGTLLDDFDLEQILATDFEPLGYPDFPEIGSPMLPFMNYAHQAPCHDIQDEMVQQDLTEFLGSLLKDPDSPEVSNFEPETVPELVPNGQVSTVTHGLVSGKDGEMNNYLDAEAFLVQEGLNLEDSGQPPFFSATALEMNTSNRYNEIKPEFGNLCENEDPIWMYPPPLPVSTTEYNSNGISVCKPEHLGSESLLNLVNNTEEAINQANSTGSGIMIRQRKHPVNQPALISNSDQKAATATRRIRMQHSIERPKETNGTGIQIRHRQHPDNASTSSVFITQQGMAARRIRLQHSTPIEGPTISKDLDSNEAKFEVNLATTEAEEHLEHQIMVDRESNFVEVCHDDKASMEVKSTGTETYKGPIPKPVVRVRAIQVTNTDIKLEGPSFKHKTSRIWTLAAFASLILVPLCVGISWFLTT